MRDVVTSVGSLGQAMAIAKFSDPAPRVSVALSQSSKDASLSTTSADLLAILIDRQENYTGEDITISDANLNDIIADPTVNFSKIHFKSCIIHRLELGRSSSSEETRNYPRFQDCVIDRLDGVVSERDVPPGVFLGSTSVERYSAFTDTNDAVMKSGLPEPVKVLLTMLRKLFLQRGTGRQYSALKRGLPPNSIRYVEPIAALIKSNQFAEDITIDRRTILIPNRTKSAEALSIINGPNISTHELMRAVKEL